jgi:hypothetical protein
MNRTMLAIGGGVIIAGGLAYWYLSQQNGNGKVCTNYTSQSECENNNCYWWSNNTCHSYREEDDPCVTLNAGPTCYPNVLERRNCDSQTGNLCECNGSEWMLIEENSVVCINNDKYYKCYPNSSDQMYCLPYSGIGTDQCDSNPLSFGAGCFAPSGKTCQYQCWPDNRDRMCCLRPQFTTQQGYVSVYEPDWVGCEQIYSELFHKVVGNRCFFDFDTRPWAIQYLINAQLGWKWGCPWPGCAYDVNLLAYYNEEWTVLIHDTTSGQIDGTFDFGTTRIFPPQGVTQFAVEIRIQGEDTIFDVNIKPTYFYGTFSF